ncbi:TldD/PmbA family protein [Candidatus Epulonipiscium viviparus]|uniref:TldD/PmbA family protein n=1 Tax=Candidatus Epulonipiscium viviparus TaxID=420336 RepID=UPI0027381406|nr:TldD/PmbA family protein [Candidatus Epulopiscium viviparus]
MLSKETLKQVLEMALSTGGDFSEIFVEDTTKKSIVLVAGKVDDIIGGQNYGIGIRVCKDFQSMYAYTNDDSLESLLDTAKRAAEALNGIATSDAAVNINLVETIPTNIHPILQVPGDVAATHKIAKLKEVHRGASEYSDEISQVTVSLVEIDQKVQIANSNGLLTSDRRIQTRVTASSIAQNGSDRQTGTDSFGSRMGFELVEDLDLYALGRHTAIIATTMLHADYCPAGRMPVAIENGFGGVIFHEACGHSLEATSVAKGNSVFCNMLGQKIANEKVTAIDDGTIPNAWGSLNIDDEGHPTQKNILIENGILKSYLVDSFNGRRMNMPSSGSGRRESYKFAPTSRMTNTYIAPGDDSNEAIIASIDYGLYAKKMGGGSVNPITGEFNFAVTEGYIIKNGKIDHPVRGASLIGSGQEVLLNIDMVGSNISHAPGMCGSSSGSVPTNVGQPLIRVREITVGGR